MPQVRAACLGLLLHGLVSSAAPAGVGAWEFVDVTTAAGLQYHHGYVDFAGAGDLEAQALLTAGGVACGDYDGDGWLDLYAVRGDVGPNLLFRNRGDGTFAEVGAAAGVAVTGARGAGPTLADVDGDGHLDLLVLGVAGTKPRLFRNRGDGTFEDVTAASGLSAVGESFSAALGDYDRDGDLDLFVSHWGTRLAADARDHLWRNDGSGRFTNVTAAAGLPTFASPVLHPELDLSFTPNFADLDDDGWPDLLVAADFGASRVLRNAGDGTFTDVTTPVISDENGMGAAVGDYDGDGRLDWFVSSIWDPNGVAEGTWRISGNRLYRNLGDASFEDRTDQAGVRIGYWGWGSTFADLNNDGHLDLVHVNGWGPLTSPVPAEFHFDPSRVFVSNGDATFTERSAELGIDDTGQGRGVVAFDYDRDGDLDLLVANNQGPLRLFRNDGGNAGHHLTIALRGHAANREAIGARIAISAGGRTQVRELRAGSNFVSQDPAEAHFGLGSVTSIDELRVRWPDGSSTVEQGVAVDRRLVLEAPPLCTTCDDGDPCTEDHCVPGEGCDAVAVGGVEGARCVCDRAAADACANDRLPGGLVRAAAQACRLLGRAADGAKASAVRKLAARAAGRWQQAARSLGRRGGKKLSAGCLAALQERVDDARSRAQLLRAQSP